MKCPYCKGQAVFNYDNRIVYGSKGEPEWGGIWVCEHYPKCDSYVGCHKGTHTPLGKMADKETRQARVKAHNAFDKLWRNGEMTRHEAYEWLQKILSIKKSKAHIALFSKERCNKLIEIINSDYEPKTERGI